VYVQGNTYVQGSTLKIKIPIPKHDWPQNERPIASVIAQHYSSATFISLSFHSHKLKFGDRLKMLFFFFTFTKLCNSGSVCKLLVCHIFSSESCNYLASRTFVDYMKFRSLPCYVFLTKFNCKFLCSKFKCSLVYGNHITFFIYLMCISI